MLYQIWITPCRTSAGKANPARCHVLQRATPVSNYNTSNGEKRSLGKDIRNRRPDGSTSRDRDAAIAQRFYLLSLARELLPRERVSICFKYRAPHRATVDVYYDKTKNSASITGVMRCTSVWNCPVCSASISMHRRDELQQALQVPAIEAYMVTYTVSHGIRIPFRKTLETISDAYRFVHSGRAYKSLKSRYDIIGSVRSLEVTYGENGWHPHFHELCFTHKAPTLPDMIDIKNALQERWIRRVNKHGFSASKTRAVQITSERQTTHEYVAKFGLDEPDREWTAADEITRATTKNTKNKTGRTPFRLLEDYGAGDAKSGMLFREYAGAMKGKRQLYWSAGLRDALHLNEPVSDGETVEHESDGMELLIMLSPDDWRAVARHNKQAEVMMLARRGDASAIRELCNILKNGDRRKGNGTNEMP